MVSFTFRPLYLQGKGRWWPLDRRLGGPQSRSGRGDEKKSQPLPRIELLSSSPEVSHYTDYHDTFEIVNETGIILMLHIITCTPLLYFGSER
jgi:hypothetical protein